MPLRAVTAGQHPVTNQELILSRSGSDTDYSLSHNKATDQNQENTNNHQVISLRQKRAKEEFTN